MAGFPRSLRACALFAVALITTNVFAVNRFKINDHEFTLGSEGVEVPIVADLDQDTYAFSVALSYDPTKVRVNEVRLGSAVTPLEPEFEAGQHDADDGELYHGIVFALSEARINRRVNSGSDREILVLVIDVIADTFGETTIDLRNGSDPGARNVMTNSDGDSLSPSLDDGELSFPNTLPAIISFIDNTGVENDDFLVVGNNFDRDPLTVTVCGNDAVTETLNPNTLRITAPRCTSLGWAEVEICNDSGCVTDARGFNYTSISAAPDITSILLNTDGEEGDIFIVEGRNFDNDGLTLEMCGVTPSFQLLPGPGPTRTLRVTAPACEVSGWVPVDVCNEFGCDTEADGFEYREQVTGGNQLPGDCNQDGGLDLSDGVCVLGHLFLGNPIQLPCGSSTGDPGNIALIDFSGDGNIDLADGVATFGFLFQGGSAHPLGRVCVRITGCPNNDRCP